MEIGKDLEVKELIKVARSEPSLLGHYRSKHECVTYSCNECVYKTVDKSTLRKHKQYKHE